MKLPVSLAVALALTLSVPVGARAQSIIRSFAAGQVVTSAALNALQQGKADYSRLLSEIARATAAEAAAVTQNDGTSTNQTLKTPTVSGALTSLGPINSTQTMSGGAGDQYFANYFNIQSDNVNAGDGFAVGYELRHVVGPNNTASGGRVDLDAQLFVQGPIGGNNGNYVASEGIITNTSSMGGTTANPKGAMFASSFEYYCSGQNLLECTGGEVDGWALAGSSMWYKALWTLDGGGILDQVQGYKYDTMLAFSDGIGDIGHQSAIMLGPMNGQFPVTSTGTIIQVVGVPTGLIPVANGIDFSQLKISGYLISSPNATISGDGVYSGTQYYGVGTTPAYTWDDTSAPSGGQNSRWVMAGGSLQLQALSDDRSKATEAYAMHQTANGPLSHTWYVGTAPGASMQVLQATRDTVSAGVPVALPMYTVAALPACNTTLRGAMAYAIDLTTVTYNGTPAGGGSNSAPVACGGTAWTIH